MVMRKYSKLAADTWSIRGIAVTAKRSKTKLRQVKKSSDRQPGKAQSWGLANSVQSWRSVATSSNTGSQHTLTEDKTSQCYNDTQSPGEHWGLVCFTLQHPYIWELKTKVDPLMMLDHLAGPPVNALESKRPVKNTLEVTPSILEDSPCESLCMK